MAVAIAIWRLPGYDMTMVVASRALAMALVLAIVTANLSGYSCRRSHLQIRKCCQRESSLFL